MSTYPGANQGASPDQAPGQTPYQQPVPDQYPGPTQSPPPVAPPARNRGQYIRLGIGLLIAVVVIGGFILFRDRMSNEVTSLAVGECFDQPAQGAEVTDVQRQPCNEPHDAEVIAVLVHTAAPSAAYPVVSGFNDYIQEQCVPVFESFTGKTFPDTELGLSYFQPTLSGWVGGDRSFVCYVSREDGTKVTSSLRAGSTPNASD